MKLQISFNLMDLQEALTIASTVEKFCDSFEVGSLLIAHYGMEAIEKFRKKFPEKTIICDNKIVEHEKEMVTLAANAGSDWVTVLAGASPNTIHNACNIASNMGKKVMLNLIDESSPGQIAVEAKSLGAHAILFHKTNDENSPYLFLDRWEMVKGNTDLPVFISTHITQENIQEIIKINPDGISIGYAITHAENPQEVAKKFYEAVKS